MTTADLSARSVFARIWGRYYFQLSDFVLGCLQQFSPRVRGRAQAGTLELSILTSHQNDDVDAGLTDPTSRSSEVCEARKAFIERLARQGILKVQYSAWRNRLHAWIGPEIRDGREEFSRKVLETVYAHRFDGSSDDQILVVYDGQHQTLELSRFRWRFGLEHVYSPQ